ncbi:MAG TPA: peptidyl-tRNA hydrolase Pth2 [archaeon]|nr:peptidyl-tRNA hydrolase Pth2 [archaeon]
MKQAIIIRTDLKMGKGKLVSQGGHASIAALRKTSEEDADDWESEGMKKVVLKVSSEPELLKIFEQARKAKLPAAIIHDAGLTQIEPGSPTAVGIGPAEDGEIDKITGKLKLL